MATAANISILGYLGSSAEVKEIITKNGEPLNVINISIAVSYKKGDSEITDWYQVEYYNQKADVSWFQTGKQLLINGRMQLETFTTNAGVEKVVPKIIADRIYFCGKKGD